MAREGRHRRQRGVALPPRVGQRRGPRVRAYHLPNQPRPHPASSRRRSPCHIPPIGASRNSPPPIFLGSTSCDVNVVQAFDFHEHAAQMGHLSACYELATKFEDGLGCIKSDESALSWYRKAAKSENFSALMRLGSGYVIGDGVTITKELGTAFQYFQRVSNPSPKVDEVCAHEPCGRFRAQSCVCT